MKLINFKNLLILQALALPILLFSQESDQEEVNPYEVLLDAINKNADVEKQFDIKRFNTIEAKVIELRNIKIKLTNDLRAAEELSDQLSAEFDDNESQLSELEEKLTLKLGNLGEMFGVVRQVAGQTKGEFENSISNLQFPERNDALQKLTEKRKLPSVEEIKVLWVELIKEIKNSGDIVTFNSKVANADGSSEEADVLRIGLFNLSTDGILVKHIPEINEIENLPAQPSGVRKGALRKLQNADEGMFNVTIDPTRGSLIDKLIQAPSFFGRINQGGLVGYFIILLGLFGAAVAGERIYVLRNTLQDIEADNVNSSSDNYFGELLKVAEDNSSLDFESLQSMFDEKIQGFLPKIESRVALIKLIATVAPLLGLLGTVIGMIGTFQAITLFGTGDPKLMAGGISQALVTTVLGLCAAIPLVLSHGLLSSQSTKLGKLIGEQFLSVVADKAQQEAIKEN